MNASADEKQRPHALSYQLGCRRDFFRRTRIWEWLRPSGLWESCAHRRVKKIVGDLDKRWSRSRTAQHLSRGGDCLRNLIWAGHAPGKAGQRPDDIYLLWSLMQRTAGFGLQRRSYVRADQNRWRVGLEALQERHKREQIAWSSRGKDRGHASATAKESIGGKARCLLVANYPMVESRLLS